MKAFTASSKQRFLTRTPKAWIINEKIYKFDFDRVKNFCFMLGTIRKMKKKTSYIGRKYLQYIYSS